MAPLAISEVREKLMRSGGATRGEPAAPASSPAAPSRAKMRSDRIVDAICRRDAPPDAMKRAVTELAARLEPNLAIGQIRDCLPEVETFDEVAITRALAHLGYDVHKLAVSPRDIDDRLFPCLFIPAGTRADKRPAPRVLLLEGGGAESRLVEVDGETGARRRVDDGDPLLSRRGTAYFARKRNTSDDPLGTATRSLSGHSWFRTVIGRFSSIFWQLTLIGFLLNAVALASPLFIMLVYDRVISPQTTEFLPILAAGVGLAIIIEFILRGLRTRLLSWLTARIHFIVGSEVYRHTIELPPSLDRSMSPTAQLARLRSFESVRDFFSGPIFVSVIEIPAVIIATGVLAFFSPVLAAVPLVSAGIFVAMFFALGVPVAKAIRAAANEASIAQKFCVETFQDRELIRASGLADIWASKYREISGRDCSAQARLAFLGMVGETLAQSLAVMTALVALTYGVHAVWAGDITTGMLVAAMILIWRALSPFYSLCSLVPRFEQFRNSVAQINKLMDVETEEDRRKARARLSGLVGDIRFDNVTVRNGRDASPVFVGLQASIKAGETIAVTGATGSGKSSVLKLVQAIQLPQLGKVTVDGFNLSQLLARDLRRQIAYVPQTPSAFPGTIRENLLIVKPDAADDELEDVLERAGARPILRNLPDGLDTHLSGNAIGAHEVELSLRVAFARVFLQDARIVLVDELPAVLPSGSLDTVLTDLIQACRGRATLIFVTQRSDHMRQADQVIGLRFGRRPIVGSLDSVLGESS